MNPQQIIQIVIIIHKQITQKLTTIIVKIITMIILSNKMKLLIMLNNQMILYILNILTKPNLQQKFPMLHFQ